MIEHKEMSDMTQLQAALRNMAAAEGTAAANLLMLHVLAKHRDPSLVRTLRSFRTRLGQKSAEEICDRLAELTSPNGRKAP